MGTLGQGRDVHIYGGRKEKGQNVAGKIPREKQEERFTFGLKGHTPDSSTIRGWWL